MKKILLFTAFLVIATASFSQDLISLKKGNRLEVIITEITPTLVRYKLFTEPQGRTYFVYKDDVAGIMYRDGSVETFNQSGGQTIESNQIENRNQQSNSTYNNWENSRPADQSINNRNQTSDFILSDSRKDKESRQGSGLKRGYKGIVDLGYFWGAGDYAYDRLNFSFINGYQVNPYFSFGIGTGIHYYFDEDSYYNGYYNDNDDQVLIPLFSDFRVNFINKAVSPYLSTGIGYSFNASDDFNGVGIFLDLSIGVSYKIPRGCEIHAGISYQMQRVDYDSSHYGSSYIDMGAVTAFKFGLSF